MDPADGQAARQSKDKNTSGLVTFKNRQRRASVIYQLNPQTEWPALMPLHMYVCIHNEAGVFFLL